MKYKLCLTFLICIVSPILANQKAQKNDLERKIFWLIEKIEKSHYIFIRNGDEHKPKEAVKHIIRKYEYYKDKIYTVEDFINYAASKSYLSGKPYLIKTSAGEKTKLKDWLINLFKKEYHQVNNK